MPLVVGLRYPEFVRSVFGPYFSPATPFQVIVIDRVAAIFTLCGRVAQCLLVAILDHPASIARVALHITTKAEVSLICIFDFPAAIILLGGRATLRHQVRIVDLPATIIHPRIGLTENALVLVFDLPAVRCCGCRAVHANSQKDY